VEDVVAAVAAQLVGAGAAVEVVRTAAAVERVVGAAAGDRRDLICWAAVRAGELARPFAEVRRDRRNADVLEDELVLPAAVVGDHGGRRTWAVEVGPQRDDDHLGAAAVVDDAGRVADRDGVVVGVERQERGVVTGAGDADRRAGVGERDRRGRGRRRDQRETGDERPEERTDHLASLCPCRRPPHPCNYGDRPAATTSSSACP
jgi:hypothetical protein